MGAGEWIGFQTPDGAARALAIRPEGAPPWPALLLLHAVVGIDAHMERLAASLARDGYLAVVPDIYSHDPGYREQRPELIEIAAHMGTDPARQREVMAHYPEAQHAAILKAREWMSRRQTESFIRTARAGFETLERRDDVRAIGTIGFCMGGRLVGELAASSAGLAAGVIYYGAPPKLELVPNISCPLEGHYASRDTPITSKVPAFAAAMKAAGKSFAYFIYEADHGFSLSPETHAHNPQATRLSMARAKAFLKQHLKPAAPESAA